MMAVSVSQVGHYLGEHGLWHSVFWAMVDLGCDQGGCLFWWRCRCGFGVVGLNGLVGGGVYAC